MVLADATGELVHDDLIFGNELDGRQILPGHDGIEKLSPDAVKVVGMQVTRSITGTPKLAGDSVNNRAKDGTKRVVVVDAFR